MAATPEDTKTTAQDADAANKATSDQSRIRPKGLLGWFGTWPLFASIATWVILAVGVLLFLVWLWTGKLLFLPNVLSKKSLYDVLKIALTTVGGIGGVAFLVMKYQDGQRDRHEEQRKEREEQRENREEQRKNRDEIHARMQDAIEQLGNEKSSVRIAGVYALTEIADRERGDYRQRVVDILCGYLRSTDRGTPINTVSNTTSAEKTTNTPYADNKNTATPNIPRAIFNDRPVESTIISVMRTHLFKERRNENGETIVTQQLPDDQLWCDCNFDFHGATFTETVDLSQCTFTTNIRFDETRFMKEVSFIRATFKMSLFFTKSFFGSSASFREALFGPKTTFDKTTFRVNSVFDGSSFTGEASFVRASFLGGIAFRGTTFGLVTLFNRTIFKRHADFDGAKFTGYTAFSGSSFGGDTSFRKTAFLTGTSFDESTFRRHAYFPLAFFRGFVRFSKTTFKLGANYSGTIFIGKADFQGVFIHQPSFLSAEFKRGNESSFPDSIPLNAEGLPEGAKWIDEDEDGESGKADA